MEKLKFWKQKSIRRRHSSESVCSDCESLRKSEILSPEDLDKGLSDQRLDSVKFDNAKLKKSPSDSALFDYYDSENLEKFGRKLSFSNGPYRENLYSYKSQAKNPSQAKSLDHLEVIRSGQGLRQINRIPAGELKLELQQTVSDVSAKRESNRSQRTDTMAANNAAAPPLTEQEQQELATELAEGATEQQKTEYFHRKMELMQKKMANLLAGGSALNTTVTASSTQSGKVRDEAIPKYDGWTSTRMILRNYVDDVKAFQKNFGLDDIATIKYLKKGLTGKALKWYNYHEEKQSKIMRSIEKYCKDLVFHFQQLDDPSIALTKLMSLYQTDSESIEEFYFRCGTVVSACAENDIREAKRLVDEVMEKEDEDERREVFEAYSDRVKDQRTMLYWLNGAKADIVESLRARCEDVDPSNVETIVMRARKCEKNNEDAHKSLDERLTAEAAKSDEVALTDAEIAAFKANPGQARRGFFTQRNSANKSTQGQGGQQGQQNSQQAQSGRKKRHRTGDWIIRKDGFPYQLTDNDCWRCGYSGHRARECPEKQQGGNRGNNKKAPGQVSAAATTDNGAGGAATETQPQMPMRPLAQQPPQQQQPAQYVVTAAPPPQNVYAGFPPMTPAPSVGQMGILNADGPPMMMERLTPMDRLIDGGYEYSHNAQNF